MDDLVAFLLARLAEEEAGVRVLTVPHDWHTGPGDDPEWTNECMVLMWPPEFHTPYEQDKHWRGESFADPQLAAFVAHHDPARVLREVAAKRRLVDAHHRSGQTCPRCSLGVEDGQMVFELDPCETLRLLALPYAAHPDYRPEWVPTA